MIINIKKGDYLCVINGDGNNAKEGSIAQCVDDKLLDENYHSVFSKKELGIDVRWIKIINPHSSNLVQSNGVYYLKTFRQAKLHEIPDFEEKDILFHRHYRAFHPLTNTKGLVKRFSYYNKYKTSYRLALPDEIENMFELKTQTINNYELF